MVHPLSFLSFIMDSRQQVRAAHPLNFFLKKQLDE
jgi:hypothetical protein